MRKYWTVADIALEHWTFADVALNIGINITKTPLRSQRGSVVCRACGTASIRTCALNSSRAQSESVHLFIGSGLSSLEKKWNWIGKSVREPG
jgi:hypothetical protein